MEFNELLSQFFSRSNTVDTLWNYYLGISLAIVGFISANSKTRNHTMPIITTAAFGCFAFFNLSGIRGVSNEAKIFLDELINKSSMGQVDGAFKVKLVKALCLTSDNGILVRHMIGDIIVISGIWIVYLLLRPKAADA